MRHSVRIPGLMAALLFAVSPVGAADSAKQSLPDVQPGKAQIVFLRHTTVNALVGTHLYDVTSGQPKLLGKVSNNRKVAIDVAPGEYVLMVGNPPFLEFMKASVLADKRYYAVIAPIWPAQWFLRPVRKQNATYLYSSREVESLMKKTKYAPLVADSVDEDKARQLADFYQERWSKWQAKDETEKDSYALHPEDSAN